VIIMIMGVSGCGKTTLGEKVSEGLGLEYLEADSFHPKVNIDKMSSGQPLNDDDRWPWLEVIRDRIKAFQSEKTSAVFTCSALKESYRWFLGEELTEAISWVYLKGSFEVINDRMASRKNHYFKADMLRSQFADLEEPAYGTVIDIDIPLEEKVKTLLAQFS